MIVTVAERTFKSKTALLTHLRGMLHGYALGQFVDPEDAMFLDEALRVANKFYDYPEEAPTSWRVQCQAMGKFPEFVFTRADGTRENPSVKRLSMTKSRAGKTVANAARRDIDPQIKEYRRKAFRVPHGWKCEECSFKSIAAADFEVDHSTPTFAELFAGWSEASGFARENLQVDEKRAPDGVMLEYGLAEPAASSWREHHKAAARLQILCRGCHVHKTHGHTYEGREA